MEMGFAKYQEDIVSRYVADQALRTVKRASPSPKRDTSAHKMNAPVAASNKKETKMSSLKKFAITSPRPLPVIVLADTSGSMSEHGKIEALNAALKEMVAAFGTESRLRAEIQVGLITFGGTAQLHLPLVAAQNVTAMSDLQADGATPMGEAFEIARQLLEDKDRIPSRAYRPVLILISDGQPTDEWKASFDALKTSERSKKATRLAMAIGPDADEAMLKEFANDLEAPLFKGHNARDIQRFFRAVTMSITTRTASNNPDDASAFVVPPINDEDLDLNFQ
jgi:uncharacterized protein YegL